MKYALIATIFILSGCGINHGLDVNVTGDNLITPWGKIEHGTIIVHSSWGKCNAITVNK